MIQIDGKDIDLQNVRFNGNAVDVVKVNGSVVWFRSWIELSETEIILPQSGEPVEVNIKAPKYLNWKIV